MLNLYSARECINKEKFIYDRIAEAGGENLVLVPDQYTLNAEQQALDYLGADCLFYTEVSSVSRLGGKLLHEQARENINVLNKNGRFMLIDSLVAKHRDELSFFAKAANKLSFITMLDDFIADFKQHECTSEDLEKMIEELGEDSVLSRKLSELGGIIKDYEAALSGKYMDLEDYTSAYISCIADSDIIKDKNIWIYGYDSVTAKLARTVIELSKRAKSVNFVINDSDFNLGDRVKAFLIAKASESGAETSVERIEDFTGNCDERGTGGDGVSGSGDYSISRSETISRIESDLFKLRLSDERKASNAEFQPEDIELVQCANQYYEAENAASYVKHLIRDEGYALKDITVICNGADDLQPVVKRAFDEYGIPVFMDSGRNISDTCSVVFIVNLLNCLRYEYNTDSILAMLKSGIIRIDEQLISDLENYIRDYKIKGNMWTRSFKYGAADLGEEMLAELDALRVFVAEPITELIAMAKRATGTRAFLEEFKQYLEEEYSLSEMNENEALRQEELGFFEEAQRTRESLDAVYDLIEQAEEIFDEEPFVASEFVEVFQAGVLNIQIGLIPPAKDGLSVGTLMRTRPAPSRAVVIIGANEGKLPAKAPTEGLFSVDELSYFKEMNFALGGLSDLLVVEGEAALYRMMSHPTEKLYMSYAMSSIDGGDLMPASIVDMLHETFPKLEEKKDVVSQGWGENLIGSKLDTLRHLVNHIKNKNTLEADVLTKALYAWYSDKMPEKLELMSDAVCSENKQGRIKADVVKGLYSGKNGEYSVSASKLDTEHSCPFRYFVAYGLSPKEERPFSSDARSVGDIYHECLMNVAKELMALRKDGAYGEESAIEDADEIIRHLIDEELAKLAENYKGGLFVSTAAEKFHMDRIREICFGAAKAVEIQISSGAVSEMLFEEGFGRGRRFKPIEIEVGKDKVLVEGRIDRVDIFNDEKIRIVDYKTGSDTLDLGKMMQGHKMQLMIYLLSTTQDKYEPAGIFYFNIKDRETGVNNATPKALNELLAQSEEDAFKLKGGYIDAPGVLEMMPESVLGGRKLSLSSEDYAELKKSVLDNVEALSEAILRGEIGISPIRDKNGMACKYCQYSAICRYDKENAGNRSRLIK